MDGAELIYAKGVLLRLAQAARDDYALAQQVRELILRTGILDIFGQGDGLNPFDLLDAGGAELLRARLGTLALAQLKQIVAARAFDPEKSSARWRSPARFADLIVTRATEQWEQRARVAAAPTMRINAPIPPAPPDAVTPDAMPNASSDADADAQLNRIASAAAWML